MFAEDAVMAAIAVRGVADNRVKNVFHVAADLVLAAGVWRDFEQRIAAGWMTAIGDIQFQCGQASVVGTCRLRRFVRCASASVMRSNSSR